MGNGYSNIRNYGNHSNNNSPSNRNHSNNNPSNRIHTNNPSNRNHSNNGNHGNHGNNPDTSLESCKDLKEFPPEIALSILSNLNATDLCLASCVWRDLCEDEILWKNLCYSKWSYTTIYKKMNLPSTTEECTLTQKPVYKSLYLILDEASLIFSFRPHQGIKYLIDKKVMDNEPLELAKLIHGTKTFYGRSTQIFLKDRTDVLEEFIKLQQFSGMSLCNSLREYFSKVHPPEQRGNFLEVLIEKFSSRFSECNDDNGFNRESVGLLCYSLLLLSIDLYSPHVKQKMTKREFIRNNRQVMTDVNTDVLSDIYDDVYLNGHVLGSQERSGSGKVAHVQRFPFYRPYGAMFEFKPMEMKFSCAC